MYLHDQKPTIMIVDDTPANLEILEDILLQQDYQVVAFPRGDMALRAAAVEVPDLILLDIMMPGMNGYDVCHQLKSTPLLQEVPVIFISALDDTANVVKAFSQGGVDYVTKPFNEEEIRVRIKTHLELRKAQLELEEHNHHLEDLVRAKVKEVLDSQMATLVAISNLAELRDDETGRHIERTRTFCRLLAKKLQEKSKYASRINNAFIENIFYAASLHDIGKIGIPDSILLKPGRLTPDEFEVMKTHVTIGTITLEKAQNMYPKNSFINMGVALTRSHHEKWNGSGYPDGLTGDDIPISARIMSLVDVYDALRSKRPYKDALSHDQSLMIIQEGVGKQFDPEVVDAFLEVRNDFRTTFDHFNHDYITRDRLMHL